MISYKNKFLLLIFSSINIICSENNLPLLEGDSFGLSHTSSIENLFDLSLLQLEQKIDLMSKEEKESWIGRIKHAIAFCRMLEIGEILQKEPSNDNEFIQGEEILEEELSNSNGFIQGEEIIQEELSNDNGFIQSESFMDKYLLYKNIKFMLDFDTELLQDFVNDTDINANIFKLKHKETLGSPNQKVDKYFDLQCRPCWEESLELYEEGYDESLYGLYDNELPGIVISFVKKPRK